MSIDDLQIRIRACGNPAMLRFRATPSIVPPDLLEVHSEPYMAYEQFATELLLSLADVIPSVRFDLCSFAIRGTEWIVVLQNLLKEAIKRKYYVILEGVMCLTLEEGQEHARMLMNPQSVFPCHGIMTMAYIGSDAITPYLPYIGYMGRDIYTVVRTGNPSSGDIQNLVSGGSMVHMTLVHKVSYMKRKKGQMTGYGGIGCVVSGNYPDNLHMIRNAFPELFLIVDGFDGKKSNGKTCSFGFDQYGHGAVVCTEDFVLRAWQREKSCNTSYVISARNAAIRMKDALRRFTHIM